MSRRLQVQVIAAVVVLVFGLGILLSGDEANPSWLRFFSVAVIVALAVLWAWDHWLWKTRLAQRFKAVPRNLTGTWAGTLTSLWIDPATQAPQPPKPAYLVIRQTASDVRAMLLTDELTSRSHLSVITRDDGTSDLVYMYVGVPQSNLQARSRVHHGSAALAIVGRPARRLNGAYWTDRDSRGQLDLNRREATLADDYASAVQLFA